MAKKRRKKTVQDLIERALTDSEFATAVVDDPRNFQREYNLNDRTVAALKSLYLEDFKSIARNFGDEGSAQASAALAEEVGERPGLFSGVQAGCYYGG